VRKRRKQAKRTFLGPHKYHIRVVILILFRSRIKRAKSMRHWNTTILVRHSWYQEEGPATPTQLLNSRHVKYCSQFYSASASYMSPPSPLFASILLLLHSVARSQKTVRLTPGNTIIRSRQHCKWSIIVTDKKETVRAQIASIHPCQPPFPSQVQHHDS
jgi:hypothetical protein